jgi:putative chitinase
MTEPRHGAPAQTDGRTDQAARRERRLYQAMLAAGIDDPVEQSMFMATMAHETGGFADFEEGAYKPERVWALRGKPLAARGVTPEELERAYATGGREAMDEYMYGDAYRAPKYRLGNDQPGDGARYAGGGYIQLTGKDGYRRMGRKIGVDLVASPELAQDPDVAARIAVEFWKDRAIGEAARAGDLRKVRKLVNGGDVGLDDFRKRQELYLQRGLQRLAVEDDPVVQVAPVPAAPVRPTVVPRPAPLGPAPVPMGTYNAFDRRRG